ncbi:MAG: hypothetical protein LBN02_01445 [Oscillospiraceae bacterium]|jgi:hypothetical protein|nr:hypothetical protein [Oscillospiraceae bacterium]
MLEQDYLCESLKGRVSYFATRYRKAHDDHGRVAILVDRKEVINMPFSVDGVITNAAIQKPRVGKSRGQLYAETEAEYAGNGLFTPWAFGFAVDLYFENTIFVSLQSENLLVRLLAILDRRVGKRTLEKLKTEVTDLPEWLQFFYNLRMESENI